MPAFLNVTVTKATEKALRCKMMDGNDHWIPRSQVAKDSAVRNLVDSPSRGGPCLFALHCTALVIAARWMRKKTGPSDTSLITYKISSLLAQTCSGSASSKSKSANRSGIDELRAASGG